MSLQSLETVDFEMPDKPMAWARSSTRRVETPPIQASWITATNAFSEVLTFRRTVERVWLHLRDRYLSHRLLDDYDAIADACCAAWNALTANRDTLRSLAAYPWLPQVSS